MMEIQLITIPAGEFLMGSTGEQVEALEKKFPEVDKRLWQREIPQNKVNLPEYQIGKYPVTNREFNEFIKITGYKTTAEKEGTGMVFNPSFATVVGADWGHPLGPESDIQGKSEHPVVQVSWCDAGEFCRWLSKENGKKYSLPTEAEWEKAARGTDGRIFPWGNEWNSEFANMDFRFKGTTPVKYFEKNNLSPYGVVDMCGNVFEWTSTTIGNTEPWPAKYEYPYNSKDGREDQKGNTRRVGRGGSYSRSEAYGRTTFRFADMPDDRYSAQGFRVVVRE